MGNLIPFEFNNHEIRVHVDEKGEPWWVLADVCEALGFANSRDVASRLEENEKGVGKADTLGGEQAISTINESGLYRIIFRSNKPEVKRFQTWVFSEVLPSIRKTGSYTHQEPVIKNDALRMVMQQSKQIESLVIGLDHAMQDAEEAKALALEALAGQQWVTIRQYVAMHDMRRQLPDGLQRDYGKWLCTYCREKGLPIYKQQSEQYTEWTYPVWTIQQTLYAWLGRLHGQGPIRGMDIHDDGISYE